MGFLLADQVTYHFEEGGDGWIRGVGYHNRMCKALVDECMVSGI